MSPLLLLLLLSVAILPYCMAGMERMPKVIHDECFNTGHWVQFDTSQCDNAANLRPVILSQDGKTRMEATQKQLSKICVKPMQFSGHAFLEDTRLENWQDPLLQYINFTFVQYTDQNNVNKASYVQVDVGPDGGDDLQIAARFTSGLFLSTPTDVTPLSESITSDYTVTGTKSYDSLKLIWCGDKE